MSLSNLLHGCRQCARRRWPWAIAPALVWLLFYVWEGPVYPYWPEQCYSPNHEYYYRTYQNLWSYIFPVRLSEFGTIKVYDKRHKLLFTTPSPMPSEDGPVWLNHLNSINGIIVNSDNQNGWLFDMPGPVGSHQKDKKCTP